MHPVKNEFEAVVDKCEVMIYTDPAECTRIRHEVAIPTFNKRDDRLKNLTDESVRCILQLYPVSGILPEPRMCGYTGTSGTVWCRFMAGCKSYQRAGSERTLPGNHQRASRSMRESVNMKTSTRLLRDCLRVLWKMYPCTPSWRNR